MEKLSYSLSAFEGPLDLLLYLISKNKLNIYDIQISQLLEQYLQHIERMKEENMDVESEFLEMAARLVHIKSVSLLPKHEEADELKAELTGQLLEYQECKQVAQMLSQIISFDTFVRQPMPIDFDMTYKRRHDPHEILLSYLNAAGKKQRKLPPPAEAFSGIVTHRIVSVASRIIHVIRKLRTNGEMKYDSLFCESAYKSELVATFLAVLELIKARRVRVCEEDSQLTVKLIESGGRRWKSNN